MTIIKCLSEKIEDELKDASDYVDLAMKWKAEQPGVAELFYNLSVDEMGHMEQLHQAVQDIITTLQLFEYLSTQEIVRVRNDGYLHHAISCISVKQKTALPVRQAVFCQFK